MVRTPPAERLTEVADAATRVFGRLGYRRTRTSDVAAEAGLSSGSVFTYVASKEALFHLVFANGFGQYAEGLPLLPLATPAPGETLRADRARTANVPRTSPQGGAARARTNRRPCRTERHRRRALRDCSSICGRFGGDRETPPSTCPSSRSSTTGRARPAYLGQLVRYLEDRVAGGYFTAMADSGVAARIVSETIVWFAWHRHEGRDALPFDDEGTRRTVVDSSAPHFSGGGGDRHGRRGSTETAAGGAGAGLAAAPQGSRVRHRPRHGGTRAGGLRQLRISPRRVVFPGLRPPFGMGICRSTATGALRRLALAQAVWSLGRLVAGVSGCR